MGINELKKIRTFALMVKESAGYVENALDLSFTIYGPSYVLKMRYSAGKGVINAFWFHISIFGLSFTLCDSN